MKVLLINGSLGKGNTYIALSDAASALRACVMTLSEVKKILSIMYQELENNSNTDRLHTKPKCVIWQSGESAEVGSSRLSRQSLKFCSRLE